MQPGVLAAVHLSDYLAINLAVYFVGGAAFCFVVLNSLLARYMAVLILSAVFTTFYEAVPDARTLSGSVPLDFLALLAVAVPFTLVFSIVLRLKVPWSKKRLSLRARLRHLLVPSEWPEERASIHPADYVKRWFVAIAAATGCTVGVLFAQVIAELLAGGSAAFLVHLKEAFSPLRLLVLVLFTIATIILVGPVEEYVLGTRLFVRDDRGVPKFDNYEQFFEELWQHFSWRRLGRFLLLILLAVQLSVLHKRLEGVAEDPIKLFLVLMTMFGPMAVSYYWCAALQLQCQSITQRVAWAMMAIFAPAVGGIFVFFILAAGIGTGAAFLLAPVAPPGETATILLVVISIVFILGIPLTILLTAFMCIFLGPIFALPAVIGGLVLDRFSNRYEWGGTKTTIVTGCALLITDTAFWLPPNLVILAKNPLSMSFMQSVMHTSALEGMLWKPMSIIGWAAGLVLSGFPQIVSKKLPSAQSIASDTAKMGFVSRSGLVFIALILINWLLMWVPAIVGYRPQLPT